MGERAGEELPAKATSLALRCSLVSNASRVTCYPLVSSYTAMPSAPANRDGVADLRSNSVELILPCRPAYLDTNP